MDATSIKGTGKDGRITKEDAVKAVPSMGTSLQMVLGRQNAKKCLCYVEKLQSVWLL